MPIIKHELHVSEKRRGDAGKYQIIEVFDDGSRRPCGIYRNKKEALSDIKLFNKNLNETID